jgi:hypothetical protein
MLCELVDVVTQSERVTLSSIASPMIEYGRILSWRNQWTLALDVFASLLSHALVVQDNATIMRAATKLARVLRELGRLEAADSAYALIFQRPHCMDRPELYWSARIGFSDKLVRHGRLKEADSIINTVITKANTLGLTDLYANDIQAMCSLATVRQDYRTAIRVGRAALPHISNPGKRNHLLLGIGSAFVGYGDHHGQAGTSCWAGSSSGRERTPTSFDQPAGDRRQGSGPTNQPSTGTARNSMAH